MARPVYEERIIVRLLEAGAMEIRDVDAGEEAFLYSTGNWGPSYIMMKGMVVWKKIIKPLTFQLAVKVAERFPDVHFVAGNVTGGMTPGWIMSDALELLLGREIPYVYVRDTRKLGGQKELITGIDDRVTPPGSNALVIEELVNFAGTTCNSAVCLRTAGFTVEFAGCILFYDNPRGVLALEESGLDMIYHFTLPELLDVADKNNTHDHKLINATRMYLKDPLGWQEQRGLEPVKEGGTR